ncbi:transcriptional regulator of RNA polII, SAGA, subunit-domain-containing protein [Gilbertella persicaria]|uniref:transcriptional regulator of RNA polII, SAGA, subunit-domain-containing protein n=1 Tax=Gilbertella persicaria TaxID=101096 RepID=UPI00221E8C7F|nr:transcriptional regulator of RNA polII, SAGA, subunit-domain-containing protein [Gilbertella persicaria]KAI8053683.1 transcriptional regulator of RNA polII, SAGA, subunit-domain-containing protein [Gilbertella persicaria]
MTVLNKDENNVNNKALVPNTKGHFHHPIANGRQDVLALKQQLADALGENGPLYWDALRDFVMGKLNRQEFDFYANLYLSRQNAHLHNAFILSTVHNAQANTPPPSKHRLVGWAKRKRGKDGLTVDESEQDPRKRKLKSDVMSLSKSDRERLKALVKAGEKNKLRPYVDRLLGPRVSRPPTLPVALSQLPPNYNQEYSKGLMAPLCIDLKELPSPETLHARMTSIALENGLLGGIGEDVVNIMLFAAENYIKSSITSAICKRRMNRCIGVKQAQEEDTVMDTSEQEQSSITLHDLAFTYRITPYVLVEKPLNAEKLTALLTESEDEELVDNLNDDEEESNVSSEDDYY